MSICHRGAFTVTPHNIILFKLERQSTCGTNYMNLEANLDESLFILAQEGLSVHLNGEEGMTYAMNHTGLKQAIWPGH